MRDEDYGAALTLAEGDDGIWSPPMAASACEQPDWRSLYEQAHTRAEKERARADAAQARAEELRRAEVDSRARAGSLKWQLDTCRNKLEGGLRGDEGGPARGEGRAFLPGGSGAAGNTPFTSRHRVEQAQHDHVAAHGGRPAGQGGEGLAGPGREPGRAACQASRDWERVVEGTLRPQERAAGEATLRAPSAASSAAPPVMAARNGPGSRSAPKSTTRPPMRACVPVARSPTWRTASVPRPSSRSKSRPTHAGSSVPGGAGIATAHRRPWKCRRPRCRGCSPTRPTGSASGHASCSSTVPASGPCTALPRGCPTRGWRSRPGRWPTL